MRHSTAFEFSHSFFCRIPNEQTSAFQDIAKLEDTLWEAADQLRANSKLTSSEYCFPILGIIFLRHTTNRYNAVAAKIAEEQATGKLPVSCPPPRRTSSAAGRSCCHRRHGMNP